MSIYREVKEKRKQEKKIKGEKSGREQKLWPWQWSRGSWVAGCPRGWGRTEPARKAEMAEDCFYLTAVSSALVRTGIQHFLHPGLGNIQRRECRTYLCNNNIILQSVFTMCQVCLKQIIPMLQVQKWKLKEVKATQQISRKDSRTSCLFISSLHSS